ncbi:MAG: hypothetical protein GXP49_06255 [Deltaproteobacteria bacterium]|nr:hypothetical protein [Deltaproteobacteria bacterium]
MRRLFFEVELLSDTVLPVNAATEGPRQCLSYIPGSVMLGVAAARMYSSSDVDPFMLFHSGKVRFLPAYPIGADRGHSLPVPLSYHHEKDWKDSELKKVALPKEPTAEFRNFAMGGSLNRPKNLEGKFFTANGLLFDPEKVMSLKTAIDPSTGRVDESKLFAYEALRAGTKFLARIHLDDDVPTTVDQALVDELTGGVVSLGRSRSAEFGRANISQVDRVQDWPESGYNDGLLIYAYSDLALYEPESGAPTLEPKPEHFGLDMEVDWDRTFIRTRRYSTINAKRKKPDLERQVVCAGSVIAFKGNGAGMDPASMRASMERGVGAYLAEGLGQVMVQPGFLEQELPFFPERPDEDELEGAAEPPRDELVTWLEDRVKLNRKKEHAWDLANEWLANIKGHVNKSGGPSKSAWSFVAQAAATAKDGKTLVQELLESGRKDGKALLRKGVRQEPWKVKHKGATLVDRLEKLVGNGVKNRPDIVLAAVQILARQAIKELSPKGQ